MSECQTKAGNLNTLTLTHSLILSLLLSYSLTLTMLNNFCFHVYAQKSLFFAKIAMWFFGPPQQHHPIL